MPSLSSGSKRQTTAAVALGVISVFALACPSTPRPRDGGPQVVGVDLFRVAVGGAPGGAFLSAWGDRQWSVPSYIAGGYVGVDPAQIADGKVGRLVQYTRRYGEDPSQFRTVCTTDRVLWWVDGITETEYRPNGVTSNGPTTVFAVGEDGKIIRYRDGRCETIPFDLSYPEGRPTFWGVRVLAPNDVWLVGGSAIPGGPRGVVVHYDGSRFEQVRDLPPEAVRENIYKIDSYRGQNQYNGALIAVGSGGVVIMRDPQTGQWRRVPTGVRGADNRLFTVACGTNHCYAVGGAGSGIVLRSADSVELRPFTLTGDAGLDDLPGLNGVWVGDTFSNSPDDVYIVGVDGFTMHTTGSTRYIPPMPLTTATLHAVGGTSGALMAVGGELGTPTPEQRGVILIRGDESMTFEFDGRIYPAQGDLRRSIGGAGQ